MINKQYYVYEWFIIDTLEVFYVGKGTGKRRFKTAQRNIVFDRFLEKYNCIVRIYEGGLTEDEAFQLEEDRIAELQIIGWAKANLNCGLRGHGVNPFENKTENETKFYKEKIIKGLEQARLNNPELTKQQGEKLKQTYQNNPKILEQISKSLEGNKNAKRKTVIMFNENEEKIFESAYDCERQTGITRKVIMTRIKNGKDYSGYFFKTAEV